LLAVLLGALRDGVWGGVRIGFGLCELFVAGFVQSGAEADVDGEALACPTLVYAADRRHVAVVAAIGYADVTKLDGLA
jgi:hypothetical protein